MQNITLFYGKPALSEFRIQKLCRNLKTTHLKAHHIYFVVSVGALSQIDELQQLLDANIIKELSFSSNQILITPRCGTISPWSSKTTDLAHRCGLKDISRIERAVYYELDNSHNIDYNIFI